MRRLLLLGSLLALPGCQSYVGNPFDGFGGFLSDTTSFRTDPNRPSADSENMKRAMGEAVNAPPLLPEPGNVWPGPPRPEPTLQDIERDPGMPAADTQGNPPPGTSAPGVPPAVHRQPRGSSTPPGSVQPSAPAALASPPPSPSPASSSPQLPVPLSAGVVQTPQGQAIITSGANGVQQYTMPDGSSGRAIPNANGTVTLIGPDGAVQSVPAPR
jgi:hypothetical protein